MKDPIIIDHLEIWPEDLGKAKWREANAKIKELGPGWRMPTLEEVENILYPNRDKIFDENSQISGKWYLSSTPGDDTDTHWIVDMSDSYSNYFHDENQFWIISVRDFTGEIALDYLLKEF
jgi:hypothetical protein